MTDDLVQRLRDAAQFFRGGCEWPATADAFGEAADEVERLRAALRNIRDKSSQMAEDDGLWFGAATAAEAYLQSELRKLCATIEGVSPDECARAAYDSGVAKDGLAVKKPMRRPHG